MTRPPCTSRRSMGVLAPMPAGRPSKPAPIALHPDAVRAWRARLGFTQAEAGAAIGVSRVRFAQYEAGGAPRMAALAMAAIEAGLGPPR